MSDDIDAVKRALRRVVAEGESSGECELDRFIERAESAVTNVRETARFAEDDGFAGLERAVEVAEVEGRSTLAERGRAVLTAVDAYRTVAADHFRPGHEGLMGGEQVVPEETT